MAKKPLLVKFMLLDFRASFADNQMLNVVNGSFYDLSLQFLNYIFQESASERLKYESAIVVQDKPQRPVLLKIKF